MNLNLSLSLVTRRDLLTLLVLSCHFIDEVAVKGLQGRKQFKNFCCWTEFFGCFVNNLVEVHAYVDRIWVRYIQRECCSSREALSHHKVIIQQIFYRLSHHLVLLLVDLCVRGFCWHHSLSVLGWLNLGIICRNDVMTSKIGELFASLRVVCTKYLVISKQVVWLMIG